MYEFTCGVCGKVVQVEKKEYLRKFCSKTCLGEYNALYKGQELIYKRTANRFVHPKGFDNLVGAICERARNDILLNPPGNWLRMDAERFFRSDFFAALTELDGDAILRDLLRKQKRRQKSDEHDQ